jgi:hypothetical protein
MSFKTITGGSMLLLPSNTTVLTEVRCTVNQYALRTYNDLKMSSRWAPIVSSFLNHCTFFWPEDGPIRAETCNLVYIN